MRVKKKKRGAGKKAKYFSKDQSGKILGCGKKKGSKISQASCPIARLEKIKINKKKHTHTHAIP